MLRDLVRKFSKSKREAEISAFWQNHADRKFMTAHLYPALIQTLRREYMPSIMEIGYQWYNSLSVQMLLNAGISVTVVDRKFDYTPDRRAQAIRTSLQVLPTVRPDLSAKFDAVVNFGVLGFYPLDPAERKKVLRSTAFALRKGGLALFKLDVTRLESMAARYHIDKREFDEFFCPATIPSLSHSTLAQDAEHTYEFLVFRHN